MPPPVLSIDFIALVLRRSLLNPFIAWMLPICLRAVATPYHAPVFISSVAYAGALSLLLIFSVINHRLGFGRPRIVNWEDEVVVVTGGSSGLGRVMVEMFGMRGVSVAVLDTNLTGVEGKGEEWGESVKWYRCDVGDADEVTRVKGLVQRDFGKCSILINNAGIVNGKPLLELSAKEVAKNFNVNLIGHFNTIRAFLPDMLSRDDEGEEDPSTDCETQEEDGQEMHQALPSSTGGTIVTIASVLGKFPAASLSDYCAAKAGLIAMHASLRAELSASDHTSNIKTVLVTPGQLSTSLFADVETPSQFFGPVVQPVDLAKAIVDFIDRGEGGDISEPLYARWIEYICVLPVGMQRGVRWVCGVDAAMAKGTSKLHVPGKGKKA